MCPFALAALIGLASPDCAPGGPSGILAAADPAIASRWRPPVSPIRGLKTFTPVDAKDWRAMNRAVMPKPEGGPNADTPGMKGMPGMGGEK